MGYATELLYQIRSLVRGVTPHFTADTFSNIKRCGLNTIPPTIGGKRAGCRKQRVIETLTTQRPESPCHGRGVCRNNLRSLPRETVFSRAPSRWELLNARSARKRKDTIREHLIDHNTDVMFLTETWLQEEETPTIKELTPLGYKCVGAARPKAKRKANKQNLTKGGGLAIIYKGDFKVRKCRVSVHYQSFEYLDAKVTTPYRAIRTVVLYRPPSSATSGFLKDFSSLLADLGDVVGPLMIVGDFNVHIDDRNSPVTNSFVQLLDEHGLTQHVSTPTHKNGHILDLFITKNHMDTAPEISETDHLIADHSSVVATVHVGPPPRKTRVSQSSRNIKNIPTVQFTSDVADGLARLGPITDDTSTELYSSMLRYARRPSTNMLP